MTALKTEMRIEDTTVRTGVLAREREFVVNLNLSGDGCMMYAGSFAPQEAREIARALHDMADTVEELNREIKRPQFGNRVLEGR